MMAIRSLLLVVFLFLFLASCGTTVKENTKENVKENKPISLNNKPPGVVKLRAKLKSGQGLESAKWFTADTNEPYKVNVNDWLNKWFGTTSKKYVNPEMYVFPITTNSGHFTMSPEDIEMVNNQLRKNGFNIKIYSKENGLHSELTP